MEQKRPGVTRVKIELRPMDVSLNYTMEELRREALDEGLIRAAGLDVLSEEPMSKESPFLGFKDSDRLFITPHIAWASLEARTRLMHMVAKNIREFLG